tara:strand:- start:5579 stop:7195 length:1617 start_codon:yes stop_codon:yes gene_type:complete
MDKIKFTPLGGLGEVGKNLLLFKIKNKSYLIDAGIKFSLDDEIDYILPDLEFIENIKNEISAIFITHGHEDHVGALSKLAFLKVPIYCPPMAAEIIRKKLYKDDEKFLEVIHTNKSYRFEGFKITWFPVVHSIPDSCGLIIQTNELNVIHTGDFRFDDNPIFGKNTNFESVNKLINKKCDLLLSDSTNSLIEDSQFSEREVEKTFIRLFKKNKKIIICSFASQISRLQIAINAAKKYDKKIVLLGTTLRKNLSITKRLNILSGSDEVIATKNQVKNLDRNKIIYFVTGSQGEEFSVLNRLSEKRYNDLIIEKNDEILMSSSVIPGNEEKVFNVIHRLQALGANVTFNSQENKLHVSGHSPQEDLIDVIKTLKPKNFIPIHGNEAMLNSHKKIAIKGGVKAENIFVLSNGDNFELSNQEAKLLNKTKVIDEVVLRQEFNQKNKSAKKISHDSLISIITIINISHKTIETKPFIKIFDRSNNAKIIKFLEKNINDNKDFSAIYNLQGWDKITEQFNKKIYKLVLTEFNKKYLIKTIFIEK